MAKGILPAAASVELEVDKRWGPGTLIAGKYEIVEAIGSGGMGTVHSARRLSLDDLVAIKSIRADRSSAKNRARFVREARAVARIRHPNVISVFDYGETAAARPYMVMEYIEGPTLGQVLAAGPVPLERALEVFAEICMAVEAGHRRGVIHRDLKPGNVMLARSDDGNETVKVLDFGLASLAEDEPSEQSRAGAIVGTVNYLSPEAIESGAASPASDIFALGVLLYELCTLVQPFRGDNAIATILAICEGSYTRPEALVPDLPQPLIRAIDAALSRSPAARPSSPAALASLALGRELGGGLNLSDRRIDSLAQTHVSRTSSSSSRLVSRARPSSGEIQARTRGGGPSLPSAEQTLDGDTAIDVSPAHGATPSRPSTGASARPELASSSASDSAHDSRRLHGALAAPPFIGRQLELDTLVELLASATHEAVPLAVVLGQPGMGRTRLLRRIAELGREQGCVALEGRFWGHEGERAPAGETFARMLGRSPDDPSFQAGSDRRSSFAALAAQLEARAGAKTLVLVLDDLHHAPRRDLEFLTYLVRRSHRECALMIVASARRAAARSDANTELSRWLLELAGLRAHTTMTLAGLDDEQLRAWLDGVFGRLTIRPRDLRRLAEASGGVPDVLAELIRHLVAKGSISIDEDHGTWACERLARNMLPEGIANTLAAQLAGLAKPLRALLETAAVIGEQLRLELLEAACALPEDELDALLDEAIALDLLIERPPESGADLSFRSATIQQVVYAQLSPRRRRRLHRAVVQALDETRPSARAAKVLARHHRAIADWGQTLRWGLIAAREALAHHDHDAAELALEHASVAATALETNVAPLTQVRLAALLGLLHARVGRYGEGETRLREAQALIEAHVETWESGATEYGLRSLPYLKFEIALALARSQLGLGKLDRASATGEDALALALALDPDELGGPRRKLEAEWDARVALGHTLARFGDWAPACAALDPVVAATPLPELRALHVLALRERGWIAARRGQLSEAEALAARARAEAKTCAEPLADYCAASVSAVVCSARGESKTALGYYRQALRLARALSLRRREMIEQANLAMSLAPLGKLDEAFKHMLSVRAICAEIGDMASAGDACVGLGKVLVLRGDLDEAIASFRRGHAICSTHNRHEYAAIALLELGRCELARARWSAAREALAGARDGLAELGSLHLWEVELALARAVEGQGDHATARAHAEAARAALEAREPSPDQRDAIDRGLEQVDAFLAACSP